MSAARLQDIIEDDVSNLSIGGPLFLTVLLMDGTVYSIT